MNVQKSIKLKSFDELEKNGWTIQMSTMNDHYILFVIRSKQSGQTIIRYFDDEEIARQFVDEITELEAQDEHDI